MELAEAAVAATAAAAGAAAAAESTPVLVSRTPVLVVLEAVEGQPAWAAAEAAAGAIMVLLVMVELEATQVVTRPKFLPIMGILRKSEALLGQARAV
jgi:hypothetical protein